MLGNVVIELGTWSFRLGVSKLQYEVGDFGTVYEVFVNPEDELVEGVDYAHKLGNDEGNHVPDRDDASDGLSTRGFEKSILESDGVLGVGDHEKGFLLVERGNGHSRGEVVVSRSRHVVRWKWLVE
jgi:hypothetical protein